MTEILEGYYKINDTNRILYWDGEKWMKPIKDHQKRIGTWLGVLDNQPKKIRSLEFIDYKDLP